MRLVIQIGILFFLNSSMVCSQSFETAMLRRIHRDSTRIMDRLFSGLTTSGNAVPVAVPISMIGVGEMYRNDQLKSNGFRTGASVLLTGLLSTCVKFGVNRPRPFKAHPELFRKKANCGPFSFPSGHTSMAFATATALTLSNPKWQVAIPSYLWAGGWLIRVCT